MSYSNPIYYGSTQSLRQFVPHYQVRSDYLPGQVREGANPTTADLLRQYEQARRQGRVFTSRPADFNPARYVSFLTHEHVSVDRVLNADQFSRIVRR